MSSAARAPSLIEEGSMRVVFLKPYEEFVEGQNVDMPGDSALNLVGRGFAEMAQEEKAAPKPKTL